MTRVMDETTLPAISDGPVVGLTTVLSLLSTLAILGAAWLLSRHCLPAKASLKVRSLFIWHAFDALVHIVLEGSYLWNCFLSFKLIDLTPGVSREASAYLPPGVHFLDRPDRLYGAEHGSSPFSALWREYSKADARWQGTDLTVISLELLTVFLGAPIAVCICWGLARSANSRSLERASTVKPGSEWFWMIVLATGELYGGVWNSSCSFISCLSLILLVIGPQNACFMTFVPEWLSGSPNLNTSNALYLWVYLTFFNGLWVAVPLWIIYEAYQQVSHADTQKVYVIDKRD